MARRKLSMNEYLEMVYQWHRGRSVRQIRDSLRMSRKTIRKYLRRLAEEGLSRERPLPEEDQLAQLVTSVVNPAVFEQPARERIRPYHQQIVDWLSEPDMTIRQVQRLLEENHELGVSYMCQSPRYIPHPVTKVIPPFWETSSSRLSLVLLVLVGKTFPNQFPPWKFESPSGPSTSVVLAAGLATD